MIATQLQAAATELKEIDDTLKELGEVNTEEVFKSVGSVMFKTDKATVEKQLGERKETLDLRKSTLERQEKRLRDKLQESQKKIQELLGTSGVTPGQGS